MRVFDDIARADSSGPRHRRSEFEFLNATAIPMAGRIRDFIEEAFAQYTGDKPRLRDRIRSTANHEHVAAVFELCVHELARRLGREPIADAQVGAGRPDLRIKLEPGGTAIVESLMLEPGNDDEYDAIRDAIGAVRREGVTYYIRLHELPKRTLRANEIGARFAAHVAALDLAKLSTKWKDNEGLAFPIKDGEKMLVDVVPFASAHDCVMSDGAPDDFCTAEEIRRGLEKKNKYKDATEPYVIAICSAKGYASDDTMARALFAEGYGDQRGFFVRSERASVSAVLACQRFKPSSMNPRLQLYVNPNAARPLRGNPFACETVERRIVASRGETFQTLMGLPENWPGNPESV